MATVSTKRLFPVRLWLLTTIIVGPVLLCLASVLYDASFFNNAENLSVLFLFIPFGLAFSLPTFIVVWLVHFSLGGRYSPIIMKWLLIFLAIIGVFITFAIIGGSITGTYSLIYAGAVIISGLILR